jgi:hypothetical protein
MLFGSKKIAGKAAHLCQHSFTKKAQTLNVSTKKLCMKLLYEKVAPKMLVKLTPGHQTYQTIFENGE